MCALPWDGFPLVEGIQEHLDRARLFLSEATASTDVRDSLRRLMASVYSSRAIVELMLHACDRGYINSSRAELEPELVNALPGYALIERLRIHDFHRFGVRPTDGVTIQGPVKAIANRGQATVHLSEERLVATTTGGSSVKMQRPITLSGTSILDEDAGVYVPIAEVVRRYIDAAPTAIGVFRTHWHK